MAKNDYQARLKAIKDGYFRAGLEHGRQQILDMVTLVLRDKEIMGKDIFGKERLMAVVKGVGDYIDKYQLAWEKHVETDHVRARLDDSLAEAYGEALHDSFLVRYPYAPEYDYTKGRWK